MSSGASWAFGRVPADGGENTRESVGQLDCAPAAFEVGADGNHPGDAGVPGARNHFRQIIRVIGIIEMGVRVVKGGHGR